MRNLSCRAQRDWLREHACTRLDIDSQACSRIASHLRALQILTFSEKGVVSVFASRSLARAAKNGPERPPAVLANRQQFTLSTSPPETTIDRARRQLQKSFGFTDFRPGQLEIIKPALEGQDVLGVLPTGAGKSLCFQLTALLLEGLTVVVSPLVALMNDQVRALRALGIQATCMHGLLSEQELAHATGLVENGTARLLFVAPERFRSPALRQLLKGRGVSMLTVDEAHCISSWGHDFRLDYRRIPEVARDLQPRIRMALTATATPEVREDIIRTLGLHDPAVFIGNFFRPNLQIEVRRTRSPLGNASIHSGPAPDNAEHVAAIQALLAERQGTGIVYVGTRAQAEHLSKLLEIPCYHAGLERIRRQQTERAFTSGKLRAIVATNAFGMGIDRADVRAVIHARLPTSLEAYYQEIGRGGRDGQTCKCLLLHHPKDEMAVRRLVEGPCFDNDVARSLVGESLGHRLNLYRLHQLS